MRSVHAVAIGLSMLGSGVAGWLARGPGVAIPPAETPSPAGESTPQSHLRATGAHVESVPRVGGGLIDDRFEALARRMDALAAEVGALRREDSARWAGFASELSALKPQIGAIAATQEGLAKKAGVPLPWPSDPVGVEEVRDRWRSKLEETEKQLRALYPQGADPRGDLVAWSRFDDHQRAKAAFETATDSASLRALSEGEFRGYFTMTR